MDTVLTVAAIVGTLVSLCAALVAVAIVRNARRDSHSIGADHSAKTV